MIRLNLVGGLGNQVFIFARGLALSKQYAIGLVDKCSQYGMSINRFNITLPIVGAAPCRSISEKSLRFDPNPEIEDNTTLNGYFQCERYFKGLEKEIRSELTLKESLSSVAQKATEDIGITTSSVAVHVRRGDFLTWAAECHGALPLDYYLRAAKYLAEGFQGLRFIVFTDDPGWAQNNFRFPYPTSVIHTTPHEDLILFSRCRHAIIANSSFSWWGAWLGADKTGTVIAPKDWFRTTAYDSRDIVPERWVKM